MKRKISILCIIVACLACLFVSTASAAYQDTPYDETFGAWTEASTNFLNKEQITLASVPWEALPNTRGGLTNLYAVRVVKGVVNWAAIGNTTQRAVFRFVPYRYGYDTNSTARGYIALYYYEYPNGNSALEVNYYQYDGSTWHTTSLYSISGQNYALNLNWAQAAYFYDVDADSVRFTLTFNVEHYNESQTYIQAYEVNRTHASGYEHKRLDVRLELENTQFDSGYATAYAATSTYANGLIGTGAAQGLALSEYLYRIDGLTAENAQLQNSLTQAEADIRDLQDSLDNVDAAGGLITGVFGGAMTVVDTFLGLGFGGITVGSVLCVVVVGMLIYVVLRFVRG